MFESEPHAGPEQPDPESVQVTPLFCESFCSEALNDADWLIWMLEATGKTETEIGGGAVTVIVEEPNLVESEMEVAVSVIVAGAGTDAGAV